MTRAATLLRTVAAQFPTVTGLLGVSRQRKPDEWHVQESDGLRQGPTRGVCDCIQRSKYPPVRRIDILLGRLKLSANGRPAAKVRSVLECPCPTSASQVDAAGVETPVS